MAQPSDTSARDAQTAAELSADVGVAHIADVYAKALWGAADKAGQTAAVLEEFDSLLADVLDRHPKFETILASGLVPHDDKLDLIERVFGPRASRLTVNFLKVLSEHGRLDCLRAIHRQVRILDDKARGRIRVELITAAPVDAALVELIAGRVRAKLGGEPVFRLRVDPALVAGAVVRIGDTVYDGSIANQLNVLRQQMMDRSAHEIQSRRDRFRHSAGN